MRQGTPSRTALRVAMRRAAHQVLDVPRVLDDPLALRILGADRESELMANPHAFEAGPVSKYFRAFMAVRSRFAEDTLAAAVAAGTRQYVVLGAGLDTFAYRNPHAGLRVYEVDFPATQAWKKWRLGEARIEIPASVVFAPVDFEHQTLAQGLADAGFHSALPTQFSMLGVVPYLTTDALDATWRFVAACGPGSGIVFDYSIPRAAMSFVARRVYDAMAARVAAAGEPFRTAFDPAELEEHLRALGFQAFQDLDAREINARYLAGRRDGLKVGGSGRLMAARV